MVAPAARTFLYSTLGGDDARAKGAAMAARELRITRAERLRSKAPVPLALPWRAAWNGPLATPVTALSYACYRLGTADGIVGYGPDTGADPALALGADAGDVHTFWERHMGGRRAGTAGRNAAGLEIALWDILGKAANLPIYRLLGGGRDRLPVYAATSRLLSKEEHIAQVQALAEAGFRAVKIRLHRADPEDDLAVVEAVCKAAGGRVQVLTDANQNNAAPGYVFWSRATALRVARRLDELGVYYLAEPLPRQDVEGLAMIAGAVDMRIVGGEHTPTVFDFREHLARGAYDAIQPDVILGGNFGITGLRLAAAWSDCFGREIIPHVTGGGNSPLALPATLQAMATVANCPLVEYPHDPPILIPETLQAPLRVPLTIDDDGCLRLPDLPGLGVEVDEAFFEAAAG
jgi:D-galactarolactone cycloisomerase